MTESLQFLGECSLIIAAIVFVGLVLPYLWRQAWEYWCKLKETEDET